MQAIMIPGPAGQLEAAWSKTDGSSAAVLCHPHPQYGGTMNDMVLGVIDQVLNEIGIATLRFNFRGVGSSDGEYDQGAGEADDLRAVVRWLESEHPVERLFLAGYSFGGAVVLAVERETECAGLVLAAPGVGLLGESPPPERPALVVVGDSDQFFDEKTLRHHFDERTTQFETLAGADHFSLAMHEQLGPRVREFIERL